MSARDSVCTSGVPLIRHGCAMPPSPLRGEGYSRPGVRDQGPLAFPSSAPVCPLGHLLPGEGFKMQILKICQRLREEKIPGPLMFAWKRETPPGQKNFPIRRRSRAGERGVFHKCGKTGKNKAHGLDSRAWAWYNKMLLWPNRAKLPLLDRERSLTWQRKNDKSKHRETNHLAGCAEKRSPTGIVQNHKRHGRFSLHPGEKPDRTNRGSNRKRVDF